MDELATPPKSMPDTFEGNASHEQEEEIAID